MARIQPPAKPETKIKLEPHQVLLRPLVTEKGVHRATRHNEYAFEVHQFATKPEIKAAVEKLFDVKVDKVCTQNRKGKFRRTRNGLGRTSDWRRAIVHLHPDHKIDFF
ncbi:50S ribosomal protein L23 [Roseiconus nitratireducens]|uniref:Large ribosomal subunit protein uL23 n=1 Tax=Roseiconus nitratireducens TaxID=2605748 RepID=A0A5M6D4T1_9BACT|nr:50S ribosomal protein L23 [Roseiconus nitratireducens]KAA5540205.1 50S ribosomal protein L23 [Roseiconus nitratireducens]